MTFLIGIRTDGSTSYGLGHISSCLALCEFLKDYPDLKVLFIMKNWREGVNKVKSESYDVITIDPKLSEEKVAEETTKILCEQKAHLLLTDLLEISYDFSPSLKSNGIKTISIDILGNINLKSDIIINRTIVNLRCHKYNKNQGTIFFVGPEYVILRKQFLNFREREIQKKVKNVLVCMGGGDEFNITTRVIKILQNIKHIKVVAVIGAAFRGEDELRKTMERNIKQFVLRRNVKNMAKLLHDCDVAVSAGGSMLYELAATGTPALIIPMNEHQIENAREFVERKSVICTEIHSKVGNKQIEINLDRLFKDYLLRQEMSKKGPQITDGRGGERVAKIIYEHLNGKRINLEK
ncbi:UDP-2,4-diacetamido-2,4,6-trideoxy-beta-L-altropyranose hydrolase [Candidatus Woesearchaeota archaeon]|nr:UDP-2,4-diacetamido-2,4,6-trideoxy-beta-L-altropyranose hydrolase [Candidatus Woesearchaeota archaeon]